MTEQLGYIYLSYDFGETWIPTAGTGDWRGITISENGQYFTAINSYNNIYTSNDTITWTPRATGRDWRVIAASKDGQIVYAAGLFLQIYKSSNGGLEWSTHASSPMTNYIGIATSSTGEKVAAATYNDFLYLNSNQQFVQHQTKEQWYGITMSSDGNIVIGIMSTKLHITKNFGQKWYIVDQGDSNMMSGSISTINGQYYCIIVANGFYKRGNLTNLLVYYP